MVRIVGRRSRLFGDELSVGRFVPLRQSAFVSRPPHYWTGSSGTWRGSNPPVPHDQLAERGLTECGGCS